MSRGLARWESCWRAVAVGVTWKSALATILVFGPELVSYERSRHDFWMVLREIAARSFFVEITNKLKYMRFPIFPGYPENGKRQISSISRIVELRETEIFSLSRILGENGDFNFQYFQARIN